jgi:hypothetical protein
MPNPFAEKGKRLERLIVQVLTSYGLAAKRVPLSGAAIGFKGDVHLTVGQQTLVVEAKSRKKGLSQINQWLGDNDALVVQQDRFPPLIVMDLRRFSRLIARLHEQSEVPERLAEGSGLPLLQQSDNHQLKLADTYASFYGDSDLPDLVKASSK